MDPLVEGMDEMCERGPELLTAEQRKALMYVDLHPSSPVRLNGDRTVAVATEVYWNEDMRTCPRGVKVQLLGAGGVAAYGQWGGKNPFWTAWAPVPARRPR